MHDQDFLLEARDAWQSRIKEIHAKQRDCHSGKDDAHEAKQPVRS